MGNLHNSKSELSLLGSFLLGGAMIMALPFPGEHWLLQGIGAIAPGTFYSIAALHYAMMFSSAYILCSAVLTLGYLFLPPSAGTLVRIDLPPPPTSDRWQLLVGEIHSRRTPEPIKQPEWLVIPERGLFTGIAVFGAIGSGKTTCCMYPFAKQLLGRVAQGERIGGLVLEVKGDFCNKVKNILAEAGRDDDYIEINLSDSPYRYNPLQSNLDAYALAYGIGNLLTSLFGKGREPFWQQAYTNMMKFIILLHRNLYGYVTIFDVYESAINPDLLKSRLELVEAALGSTKVAAIDPSIYLEADSLTRFRWEKNSDTNQMESLLTEELRKVLVADSILHEVKEASTLPTGVKAIRDPVRRSECEAVKRWFEHDWNRIEPRLRTSIVEGISFFLSLFDDNPTLKRVFCPPKECFDANSDGRFGLPLAPFGELIEQGKVVALNFPMSTNPALARMIGTLMKMDFQRAVLDRVQKMEAKPDQSYAPVLFLCDEYHAFATVGANEPTGDEKFFAQARQSRCIPIVATQSISSLRSVLDGETWRTLLQTFRTKIFLCLSDDFSAGIASELCGRDEQLKVSFNFAESGQDAEISMWSGRSVAETTSVTASKSYIVGKDNIFEPRVFSELKNAQAIVLAYDGSNPIPPTFCFLKPSFLDSSESYFDQVRKGLL